MMMTMMALPREGMEIKTLGVLTGRHYSSASPHHGICAQASPLTKRTGGGHSKGLGRWSIIANSLLRAAKNEHSLLWSHKGNTPNRRGPIHHERLGPAVCPGLRGLWLVHQHDLAAVSGRSKRIGRTGRERRRNEAAMPDPASHPRLHSLPTHSNTQQHGQGAPVHHPCPSTPGGCGYSAASGTCGPPHQHYRHKEGLRE